MILGAALFLIAIGSIIIGVPTWIVLEDRRYRPSGHTRWDRLAVVYFIGSIPIAGGMVLLI